LIVVPDATRRSGAGQVVNVLVRRLVESGTAPSQIKIIFATGIHRNTTLEEKKEIVTPFVAARIRLLDHFAKDKGLMKSAGFSKNGYEIRLNENLFDADVVITIGAVNFHYFAGFTGGRKLICPGLASEETVRETHKLAFDFEKLNRREGVGPGLLENNPVHHAFMEAASRVENIYSINLITSKEGYVSGIFCGDLNQAHLAAASLYQQKRTVRIGELYPVVIVSCGGYPNDINMIQAHKALDAAARACQPGGKIILLAECRDGLGRDDFLDWFFAEDSRRLAERLSREYEVNGQTAWNLLRIAENFDVRIVTELSNQTCRLMRLKKYESLADATEDSADRPAYVLPEGASVKIELG
ncbi:MAG TPA: nickel-dependent lactate racemase, partial [Pyrinomonadaceae bacterium]|nr:nickel-dependent lactate racemase [Pyrinomonadaceae bacterium]